MGRGCSRPLGKRSDGFCGGEGHGGREGPVSIAPRGGSARGAPGLRPPGAAKVESGRCGRGQRLLPENGPRRPQAGPGGEPPDPRPGDLRQRPRRRGGKAETLRGGRRRQRYGRKRSNGWGWEGRDASRRGTQLTVPPSLMMIFLASMILRFAARFFFFPWVILPSSSPGAAAATPGAAGPSGECRPATTAGPSRSGRPPPS